MKKFISVLTFSVFFGVFAYAQTNDNSDATATGNVNVEKVVAEPVTPHAAATHDGKDCDMTSTKSCCDSKKGKSSAKAGKKSCCMAKAEAAPAKTEEN